MSTITSLFGKIFTAPATPAARRDDSRIAFRLTGDAPFTAKLHPEYAPYADYDQLMRLEEWFGREGDASAAVRGAEDV